MKKGAHVAMISPEAHRALKLCSVITGREMYDIASDAILALCQEHLRANPAYAMTLRELTKKKRR